jgi:dCTP diphosphatase
LQLACQGGFFCAGRDCAAVIRPHHPAMAALTDADTTIAELKNRLLGFVREREWEQFHSPKNLSMALAAESGELMEHFLWATPEQSLAIANDVTKRSKIADELADVVIYALEFANITGLDVAAAIEAKMASNAKKYPVEKARGRADKYTEL